MPLSRCRLYQTRTHLDHQTATAAAVPNSTFRSANNTKTTLCCMYLLRLSDIRHATCGNVGLQINSAKRHEKTRTILWLRLVVNSGWERGVRGQRWGKHSTRTRNIVDVTLYRLPDRTSWITPCFRKKTSTHIIGYKLGNSCLILIIFDIKIPHIIWHRKTA